LISAYQNQLWIIHHSTQGFTLLFKKFIFIGFYSGFPKEQATSHVLLDIENDHYLIGLLALTLKTKLISMGLFYF
jgi:hypothetical protein